MKRFLLLVFFPCSIFGQNTIGLPDIINYSKQSFNAGLQNWDIKQDSNGIIYFANNEGLLSFDGTNWNLYPLPNKTIVRSVTIGFDGKIYVGGQDELGYFSPAGNGQLAYHSLTPQLPAAHKNFGDVWDIVSLNRNIYFRSSFKIFKFSNQAFATFSSQSEWTYLGVSNGVLYAHNITDGLFFFENDALKPLRSNNIFPANDPVTSMISITNDNTLITTLKNGFFLLTKEGVSKINTTNDLIFKNARIYAATKVSAEWIALATNNNGVIIADVKGNIIQRFTTNEGLQKNNVLSIFSDKQQNLWLGLDNGIDMIAYNSAIKQIKPTQQDGSGYTAILFNKKLYTGTTTGLYSVPIPDIKDLSYTRAKFDQVKNAQGQIWGLSEINNHLLMGHHEGAFEIIDNTAVPISTTAGFWNFLPLSTTFPSSKIIAGNYNGLTLFDYAQNKFQLAGAIPDFLESSRFTAIDQQENIWVSHPYHGVFKLKKNAGLGYAIATYKKNKGLPSDLNNHVYKIKNEVVIATDKGVYQYNPASDTFNASQYFARLLGNQSIRYLKEDPAGNVWFIHDKSLGVIDLSDKEPRLIYLPEMTNKLLSGFEFIYPVNESNIFIGGETGFFHLNYQKYKQQDIKPELQIRKVTATSKSDSIYFGGYFNAVNERQVQNDKNIPEIPNGLQTLRFEFSSTLFGYQTNLEYSYRLKGLDKNWSVWGKRTDKEYTNLPPGNFTFEVKVRNNLGVASGISSFQFELLPPWYLTLIAKIIFFLIFIAGNFIFFRWLIRKFKKQQQKHEEEQKRLSYIHELELNKTSGELVKLKNEKLESEINYKNSELASSAMHLVKKGEMLSKVKAELTQVMKTFDNAKQAADIKKLIKAVSEDDNMDQEWDQFAKHFDKVHSDFVVELKEKHPGVTPNELKLSAYLRMNLSTKEIAQLMNISVRGVEISRYRLRKKLQLPSETSLFDYLISIKPGG